MTRSPLWREFESGENFLVRMLRLLILAGGFLFLVLAGMLESTWLHQLVLGLLIIAFSIWIDRGSRSYLVTLTLMLVSCYSTFRYGYWRVSTVINFFTEPGTSWTLSDAFFILSLLSAECYAFCILFLGFLQTLWPLRRSPAPLPEDTDLWPEVDLLIPTYNEPLNVVRYTALAAMNIDWPADKLNIYILDDGKRAEFRSFAEEVGLGYMTREDLAHAKAGNINCALKRLEAPFVAIFDSDHVPTRSFLQLTMGWFGRDTKLGLLQTPHHFYSPDPFERNLNQFRITPNEGELFYGVVQDGNDFWNATFFCGSCAVLRRNALDEIGGIAVETVTEDAHTSLRMQMHGWNTAYINIPQAAGLATERLSGHVKQRIRWARGMVQILRVDNPLFAPGLNLAQRLCYFNAMTHFLYALPRLIFLTAPLIYLLFGRTNIPGYWAAILAYALPHLVLSNIANSRIQGQHRHSFWNEIYETVMAPYILLPTVLAMLRPKSGKFHVTEKGGVVDEGYFDTRTAQPFILLLLLNIAGLLCAIPRYFRIPVEAAHWPLNLVANMYDGTHPGTIVMNVLWTLFNTVILGVATSVAWESQQRRQTVRVTMAVPAGVVTPGGSTLWGVTSNMSSGGVMMTTETAAKLHPGDQARLVFPVLDGEAILPATVIGVDGQNLRAHFDSLTIQEEEALTMVLYSRADTWLGWGEAREADHPLRSLMHICWLSMHGLRQTFRGVLHPKRNQPKLATSILPLVLCGVWFANRMVAQVTEQKAVSAATGTAKTASGSPAQATAGSDSTIDKTSSSGLAGTPSTFDKTLTLADLGIRDAITLRGVRAFRAVSFSIPQNRVVKLANLKLKYHFSPGLLPDVSRLNVRLNGKLVATVPIVNSPAVGATADGKSNGAPRPVSQDSIVRDRNELSALLETSVALPVESLTTKNELAFEFIGHYTLKCEDASSTMLWSHIDSDSSIELVGDVVALPDDLGLLPLPFYDAATYQPPSVPIVFLSQPSVKGLQAAGVVASWFGMLGNSQSVRFPVTVGQVPPGNVVLISENSSDLRAMFHLSANTGSALAMRPNPVDPSAKILLLTGDTEEELLEAARVLALQRDPFAGTDQRLKLNGPLKTREPDDAPRWLPTGRLTTIGEMDRRGDFEGDGSIPLELYSRLPPDLYYGDRRSLAFHMFYRYNAAPLAGQHSVQTFLNGAYLGSTPKPHVQSEAKDLHAVIAIPVSDLRPFSNSMLVRFVFQAAGQDSCQESTPANPQGTIRKDSYIDLRGVPHWATLPNLEIFANAGYPFTRMADLADTAIVLPDTPTPEEIEMFLTFMGHFGAQTGYPGVNVTVTNADGMSSNRAKDILLIGVVDDLSAAIQQISSRLPVKFSGSALQVEQAGRLFGAIRHAWWKIGSPDQIESGRLESQGTLPDALIEGIESPFTKGQSVVVIALRDKSVVPAFLDSFLKASQSSAISKSVSLFNGLQFTSYRVENAQYHVGILNWWVWWLELKLLFSVYPWLLGVVGVGVLFTMAAMLRTMLRRHARRRLQGTE